MLPQELSSQLLGALRMQSVISSRMLGVFWLVYQLLALKCFCGGNSHGL